MKRLIIGALCGLSIMSAQAVDFFSTDKCDQFFTYGARIGFNTCNRTIGNDAYKYGYTHESWGTGFDIGAVANFHLRDYIAIQPGIFFESRSGSYVVMNSYFNEVNPDLFTEYSQAGNRRSYNFTIPIMAIVGFNVTDDIRWNVEAGPYIAFVLNSKVSTKKVFFNGPYRDNDELLFNQKANPFDFGFKLGTGLEVMKHYYLGIHYMAGCVPAWKDKKSVSATGATLTEEFGGCTKGWVFTLGYNF